MRGMGQDDNCTHLRRKSVDQRIPGATRGERKRSEYLSSRLLHSLVSPTRAPYEGTCSCKCDAALCWCSIYLPATLRISHNLGRWFINDTKLHPRGPMGRELPVIA